MLVAQTILKFKEWGPRQQAHAGRKVAFDKKLPIFICHDLTKRRYQLLRSAKAKLKQIAKPDTYAFADVNCNLIMRSGKDHALFNSKDELD